MQGHTPTRPHVTLTEADTARLTAITTAPASPQKHVWRARIILAPGAGATLVAAARQAGVARPTALPVAAPGRPAGWWYRSACSHGCGWPGVGSRGVRVRPKAWIRVFPSTGSTTA